MNLSNIINHNPANTKSIKKKKIYKLKGYYTVEKYSYKNIEPGLDSWLFYGIWPVTKNRRFK